MKRKFLSLLLVVYMVLTTLPATVFAAELPQIDVMVGIQGRTGDVKAITLNKSEITVTPDCGATVLITLPGNASCDLWCSVTGDKNAFTAMNSFLDMTEANPGISDGTQPIYFKSTDNLATGIYTMTVTIYGKNHDTSEAYAPATLTVNMTVSEPTAKWGTDSTYAVGSGTLVKAVAYANSLDGGTAYIQLQSNVAITQTLKFNKTTVLDLNGKTIDAQGNCTVLTALGKLTLTDSANTGKITGGSSDSGGGVYVGTSGSFTMTGGEITGNTTLGNGGGVYVAGSMTVGGTAKVTGNTKNSAANNVYLTSGKTIAVSTVPQEGGPSIGVRTQTVPSSAIPVNITGANGSDMSGYFVSDRNACVIQNSGSGAEQVVQLAASDQTTDVLISTTDQLKAFAAAVNAGDDFDGKTVKLTSDVTLTGEWTPIGTMDKPFAGTFDGQEHTISGMSITGNATNAGFFLAMNGAAVQNLTVSGSINVTGQGAVGGITASALADTTMTNCHSTVQITADIAHDFSVGGIVASAGENVKIDGCSNNGEIKATITNDMDRELYVGGITGFILGSGSSFKNCTNTGALTAVTTGSDNNTVYLGGIVGNLMTPVDAFIINCYNAGTLNANVSGSAAVGGITGVDLGGQITNCYHSGIITSTAGNGKSNSMGSIVGCAYGGSVTSSYWKAGTADTCVQTMGNTYIYNCGTFDTAGELTATTDKNAGTEYAEHGLSYGNTLLDALNAWVKAQATSADYQTWIVKPGVNNGYPIFGVEMESAATPTFSPMGGTYSAAQNVTISCATTGADIYYTTNGTTPTIGSIKYTTPISVSSTTTLKAIAVKSGLADSDVATAAYTIQTGDGGHTGGGSYTPPADNKPETVVTVPVEATASTDSKGNATVTITQDKLSEIFRHAQQIAMQQGVKENGIVAELTVNTPADTQSLTINLPKAIQDTLVKEDVVELKIHSSVIEIGFDKAAISAIQSTAGTDAQMTAKPATVLSTEAKTAIGSRPVFDLTLTCGGKTMNRFGTGKVYVGIPYTLGKNEQADNIAVVYVDEGGKVTWLKQSSYDATRKMVFFTTDHFSTYGVAYKSNLPAFSDIDAHWAKDNILFVINRGVFTGIGNGKFGPDLPLTREMFVTALGRLAHADVSGYQQSSFSDVKKDAYSMGYIEWASKNSIVNGIGNGKFAPNQAITREQMAIIMQNYTNVIGFTLPKVHAENTFADSAQISTYAKEAVKQMQMAGVLSGKTGNLFDPQGNATRAEVSAVFKRFVELFINSDTVQGR